LGKPSIPYILFAVYLAIGVLLIILFDGTGDDGDSVNHYLFARYAPIHPALFFNHWAKPIFTFLAARFAQFGLLGIKAFNLIVSAISSFLVFKTARTIGMKNPWMAMLIMLACPFGFVVALSGLTEPLFGLFTAIGIHLLARERYTWSAGMFNSMGLKRVFVANIPCVGLIALVGFHGLMDLAKKLHVKAPSVS
jgi:hypothetical protein